MESLLISIMMRTIIWTLLAATSAVFACKPSASDISKKFEDKNDHVAEYVEPDSLTPDGEERDLTLENLETGKSGQQGDDNEKRLWSINEGRKPEEDLIGIKDETERLKRKTKIEEERRPANKDNADHLWTRFFSQQG